MFKTNRVLSFALAFLLLAMSCTGAFAEGLEISGNIINDDIVQPGEELPKLEVSALRSDIEVALGCVEGIEPENDEEKEVLDKFHEGADKLSKLVDQYETLQMNGEKVQGLIDGGSIYQIQSIPMRIQLLIRISRAIRFGTTELSNKVVAAHTKLTEYILVGILKMLNPFAGDAELQDYINSFDALEQELLSYPDLTPGDIATIYKKAAFNRVLREARQVRNSANKIGKKYMAKKLGQLIDEGVSMIFRVTVTCGELDEMAKKIEAEIERINGPKIRVEKIAFMEGEVGFIPVDKTTRLSTIVFPNEAKNKEVMLYSTNSFVARVSGGEIVPLKTGTVMIKAVSKDSAVSSLFEVRIVEPGGFAAGIPPLEVVGNNYEYLGSNGGNTPSNPPVPAVDVKVEKIYLSVPAVNLELGENFDLGSKITVFPEDAVDKTVSYSSDNTDVAVVNSDGIVEAVGEGSAKIKVASVNGVFENLSVFVKGIKSPLTIDEITNSNRKGGIFTVYIKASKDGKGYTGPSKLVLESDGTVKERTVYLKNGSGEITFNGFDFGVWKDDFFGKVSIGDVSQDFEIHFQ